MFLTGAYARNGCWENLFETLEFLDNTGVFNVNGPTSDSWERASTILRSMAIAGTLETTPFNGRNFPRSRSCFENSLAVVPCPTNHAVAGYGKPFRRFC